VLTDGQRCQLADINYRRRNEPSRLLDLFVAVVLLAGALAIVLYALP
jgi:hypothetical protein